ncbi:MAG: MBOAT family protein [Ekhidna sp.]|nr:MBOAT family protein [Ekhidna sp.]
MNFISLDFLVFFAAFFCIYWFVLNRKTTAQNILILAASYLFYGWWDWRFLILIFVSSLVDYLVGIGLSKSAEKKNRKRLLYLSLAVNLGLLGFFKYFNFFIESFVEAFNVAGGSLEFKALEVILPVGISFYTLQTLSYTIDVYDQKMPATKNIVNFFAYVSFFPQLVAGPIERAINLLPQFKKERHFDYDAVTDGARQAAWGIFKKMMVANQVSSHVYLVYNVHPNHSGSTLFINAFIGAFWVYCDFSAYSDIAIGTARMIGFKLMKNFDYPFFSRNISELWSKWHISLITWFRDYVVKRLKGFSKPKLVRNIFILTGIWHGANWTYIVWGGLHALFFVPIILTKKRKKYRGVVAQNSILPSWREAYQMIKLWTIFSMLAFFFQADTIRDVFIRYKKIFSLSLFSMPHLPPWEGLVGIVIVLVVEWIQRRKNHGMELDTAKLSSPIRWSIYASVILIILFFGKVKGDFIYFQF